jgi:hypothetical protein
MPVESGHPNGEVFLDTRGQGRALRLTWHHEADLVVLSLWRDRFCAGTFRLSRSDVNDFVDALIEGLRDASPATDSALNSPAHVARTGAIDVSTSPVATRPDEGGFVDWALNQSDDRATA